MSERQQDLTSQQAISLAVQHHTAGALEKAETIYQRVLQDEPDHPVALHLLGMIAHQVGKNELATQLISKALSSNPNYAEALCNLASYSKRLEGYMTRFPITKKRSTLSRIILKLTTT